MQGLFYVCRFTFSKPVTLENKAHSIPFTPTATTRAKLFPRRNYPLAATGKTSNHHPRQMGHSAYLWQNRRRLCIRIALCAV